MLYGGDRDFSSLEEAFIEVSQIAVIGWSSQGPAQAQNLRDSLEVAGADTSVVVGLRRGSRSVAEAEKAGFSERDGTLLTPDRALNSSQMSLMLISDAALALEGQRLINDNTPRRATIGFSHGLMGNYESTRESLRNDLSVVGVCPKGMGPSVRTAYEQGTGINANLQLSNQEQSAKNGQEIGR